MCVGGQPLQSFEYYEYTLFLYINGQYVTLVLKQISKSSHILHSGPQPLFSHLLVPGFPKSFCSIPPSAVRMAKIKTTKPQNPIGVSQTLCYVSAAFHVGGFFLSDPLVTDCLIPQGFAAVRRPQQRRCFAPRHRRRPRGGEGGGGDVHCQGMRPRHARMLV